MHREVEAATSSDVARQRRRGANPPPLVGWFAVMVWRMSRTGRGSRFGSLIDEKLELSREDVSRLGTIADNISISSFFCADVCSRRFYFGHVLLILGS